MKTLHKTTRLDPSPRLRFDFARGWSSVIMLLALALLAGQAGTHPAAGSQDALRGMAGAGSGGFQIVNLDENEAAAIVADMYNQNGSPPVSLALPDVSPSQLANLYLPARSELQNGAYAAVVNSDRPIGVLSSSYWSASGGAVHYEQARSANSLVLPWVVKDYVGQNSLVNIQNSDLSAAASVELDVMPAGSFIPEASIEIDIGPGTSATIAMARFAAFDTLPSGFMGWMRIRSNREVAAVSLVDVETSVMGVADVAAQPDDFASDRLSAPMVFNAWGDAERTSGIALLNPFPIAAEVTLRYEGLAGTCEGETYEHGPAEIVPGGILVFQQSDVDLPGTGASGLPAGCAASASIVSDSPLMGSVSIRGMQTGSVSNYPALLPAEAANVQSLPNVRREHVNQSLTSEIHVSNPGPLPAEVTLELRDSSGALVDCGEDCQATLDAGGAARFDLHEIEAFFSGTYGSAKVLGDQPVLSAVLDGSDNGTMDDGAYTGLSTAGGDDATRRLVPILLKNLQSGNPAPTAEATKPRTATPGPSPTPFDAFTIFAIGFVDVVGGDSADCPGCDRTYDPEDEAFAKEHPLGAIRFIVRDSAGNEVVSGDTEPLATLQRVMLDVPVIEAGDHYVLEMVAPPGGWDLCPSDALIRRLDAEEFQLGNAREDFHFYTGCPPRIAPPPTALPSPTPTPQPWVEGASFSSTGAGGIQLLNLSPDAISLDVDLRAFGQGELEGTIHRPEVSSGHQSNIYLPSESRISNGGYSGSVRTEGDMPATLVRHDWLSTGAATIYTDPQASEQLILPEVSRAYENRFSVIALKNSDEEQPAKVQIDLHRSSTSPLVRYSISLPAGGSELLRIDQLDALPAPFNGWARITADRPVSAVALTDSADMPGIYSHAGLPEDGLSTELVAPAVFRAFEFEPLRDGPNAVVLNSGFDILNPNVEPASVRLSLKGSDDPGLPESCRDFEDWVDVRVFGGTRATVYFGGMPEGCVGSATIVSDGGPIAAFVTTRDILNGFEASYLAGPATRVLEPAKGEGWQTDLPLLRRAHTSSRLHTPVNLLNLGSEAAEVRIMLIQPGDQTEIPCPEGCTLNIPAGTSRLWRPDSVSALADNSYGMARVFSDQPLDMVVHDLSYAGITDISSYRGLVHEATQRPSGLPFLLKNTKLDDLGVVPEALQAPILMLPDTLPDLNQQGRMLVPLRFRHRVNSVNKIRFGLDIDERWLEVKAQDVNLQHAPGSFETRVTVDESNTGSEVVVELEPQGESDSVIPDNTRFEIWLSAKGEPPSDAGWLRIASDPAPSAWKPDGQPLRIEVDGGWRKAALPWSIYLPFVFRPSEP